MSQRLNQKLSRTSQETRRGGDKITKNTSAEQYKRKVERLQNQLTVVEAKLAAANAEISQMHKSPHWRLVAINYSDIQLASSSDSVGRKHCKRCNEIFDKPSLLLTHPCWPGHPPGDLPTRCNACGKNLSSHSSLTRHKKRCKPISRSQGKTTPRRAVEIYEAGRRESESVTLFDSSEVAELTAPSNKPTAVSQQQLSTNPTYSSTAIAGPSPMHCNPVEHGQSDKITHHMVDQSYNCTADSFEVSGDQGQAFFLDPFRIHQYGNADYELGYGTSFTEQSQLLIQHPFGDCSSHALPSSASDDRGLQFSQCSLVAYNDGHESRNASTAYNALSPGATEFHVSHLA